MLVTTTQERDSNKAAADILTEMIQIGDAEQDANGVVRVSKRKSDMVNVIGNAEDL